MGSELRAKAKEGLISSSFFLVWSRRASFKFPSGVLVDFFVFVVAVVDFRCFCGRCGCGPVFRTSWEGFSCFYQSILLTSAGIYSLERDASSSGVVLVFGRSS